MTEWILVVLTAVYVIATVFISISNSRSAKATREQIAESHAQFIEANRAFVNVDFDIIRDALFVLRITNNGNRTAQDVHIVISDNFRRVIHDKKCAAQIELLNNSTFSLGVGQTMYARLGITGEFDILSEEPIGIILDYSDSFSTYHEIKDIRISQYGWSLLYDSPISDICSYMKSVSESMRKINDKMGK